MATSIFQSKEESKSEKFKANTDLNGLITELSSLLKPIQQEKRKCFVENYFPIGFIVGNPRSGTTLFLQWIASLNMFSYPTNVLNRFAYAPYIGALIQQMLYNSDYDFHNEFDNLEVKNDFNSNLGKTRGALAVCEFQHFFRSYMINFDPEYLTNKQLKDVDFQGIKSGLVSIEQVFNKPFVMKAVMLQYNLDELYKNIPNSFFIYMKRNPILNMQSILIARENYYSDRNIWWSVKPKEYIELKDMDIYHQIAGQVFYSNKAIDERLDNIPKLRKIKIQYEDFCSDPESFYYLIKDRYEANGYTLPEHYSGIAQFNISNKIKLQKNEIRKLEDAYNYFAKK